MSDTFSSIDIAGDARKLEEISAADLQRAFEERVCLREMYFQSDYFVIDWVSSRVALNAWPKRK